MARGDFFTEAARAGVRRAVEAVETQTAAELVVTVHRRSGQYREADYLAGSLCAFAVFLVLLFHPYEIPIEGMPVIELLAFAFGAFTCSGVWALKRALTPKKEMDLAVARAARAAFVDGGVTRTTGRNGVLVLVSVLERRIDVVCDLGVDVAALGAPFRAAVDGVRAAIAADAGVPAFTAALARLGPVLGAAMPRAADDVNELPDDPVHA